jgi:hypothetical protein
LTTAACLLALISLAASVALIFDWFAHLSRSRHERSAKAHGGEGLLTGAERRPFSTRTLGFQAVTLSFLTVWLLATLIPTTIFVRTRSARVTVNENTTMMLALSVDARYWDYGFCKDTVRLRLSHYKLMVLHEGRCLAAAPWFSFIFSFPATFVTWVAWKLSNSSYDINGNI